MKKILIIIICTLIVISCNNKTEQKEKNLQEIENTDNAKEWLQNIFRCKSGKRYCFYLDKEEQICTKRFYEFMTDSEEIYGASNLTKNEYLNALKKYKQKWTSVYPVRDEHTGESFLFGRGNDDMENIENVEITKISELQYSVFVDFGNDIRTRSKVTLVLENNDYKIDYCETEFLNNKNEHHEAKLTFPQTGKKSSDFLPKLNTYEIQYETKGDLNQDGLEDIVVVLKNKKIKTEERPILILLQNEDKSYRLDRISNFAMPIEYAENGFQRYISEKVRVKNGVLNIQSFGVGGPSGNLFSTFKYVDNELILTFVETYNVGAGSWQQLCYNLEKHELTEEITNTMEEDMSSKEKTFMLKKEKYLFEKASPDDIISKAYKQIDSEW